MNSCVIIQFRVKSGYYLVSLAGSDDVTIDFGEHLTLVAQHFFYIWRTDESHWDVFANGLDSIDSTETPELATIGVPEHLDAHCAKVICREKDHASAGAKDRKTFEDGLADGFEQTKLGEQMHLRRALSTW